MYTQLKALILETEIERVETFLEVLKPEIVFSSAEPAYSLHEALDLLISNNFHVCFVSDRFDRNGVEVFMKDIAKLDERRECICVLIQDMVPDAAAIKAAKARGFATIVSRACVQSEKRLLQEVIKPSPKRQHFDEVERKIVDVRGVVDALMKELDHAAMDEKRGAGSSFTTIIPEFIELISSFDEEVLKNYYECLEERLAKSKPSEGFTKLKVPDEVLKRKLPKLTQESYTGTSRRVWKKLSKKFRADKESES